MNVATEDSRIPKVLRVPISPESNCLEGVTYSRPRSLFELRRRSMSMMMSFLKGNL